MPDRRVSPQAGWGQKGASRRIKISNVCEKKIWGVPFDYPHIWGSAGRLKIEQISSFPQLPPFLHSFSRVIHSFSIFEPCGAAQPMPIYGGEKTEINAIFFVFGCRAGVTFSLWAHLIFCTREDNRLRQDRVYFGDTQNGNDH
ncbi:MAG: hypothetical protein L0Z70_10195 [Chloroflexi bacterium]|nr:hypothetical protein [Chloroflexota bacterium]